MLSAPASASGPRMPLSHRTPTDLLGRATTGQLCSRCGDNEASYNLQGLPASSRQDISASKIVKAPNKELFAILRTCITRSLTTRTMVLKLLPAVSEDAPKITLLLFDAAYPDDPFICMTYPEGPTPEAMEHRYADIAYYFDDPIYEQWKVIDTDIRETSQSESF